MRENIKVGVDEIKSKIIKWEEDAKKRFGFELESEFRREGFELLGNYPLLKSILVYA